MRSKIKTVLSFVGFVTVLLSVIIFVLVQAWVYDNKFWKRVTG